MLFLIGCGDKLNPFCDPALWLAGIPSYFGRKASKRVSR